jgi:hypothetical protein
MDVRAIKGYDRLGRPKWSFSERYLGAIRMQWSVKSGCESLAGLVPRSPTEVTSPVRRRNPQGTAPTGDRGRLVVQVVLPQEGSLACQVDTLPITS